LVDLQTAQDASAAADTRAAATHTETVAASSAIEDARKRLDEFIRAIYEQGVQTGSLGQLAEAANPEELVERAELTEAVAQQQRDALDALRRAQVAKVNADSLAREALLQAQAAQAAAVNAKHAADGAVASARSAVAAGLAQLHQLDAQRVALNQRLDQLTATDAGLRAQRQQYLAYQQQLASQNEVAARSATGVGSGLTGGVRSVINRALSQLGVSYAWGGGNGSGPTKGIRDGGVADEFGDYRKTGFDCSGLMIYAFEAAGISLPHYSGYQYDKGKKVPISQMRPGDMLFWADGSTIHHVALYIGNGKMIEAPYSGGKVRITAVRYGDGLMPYAIRLL
jgi:cell wall-associated NlpC family hydrolase